MNSKVNSKEKKIKARLVVFQASLKGRREPGYQPVDVSSPAFVHKRRVVANSRDVN